MHETPDDIDALKQLIERSNAKAGGFLRSSFGIPENTLTAEQLINKLHGINTLALGTVTSDGRPRVAPVIALFVRGSFYIPTVRDSLRARHVSNNPAISLSVYEGNDFAVIVHGTAEILGQEKDDFSELVDIQIANDGGDVRNWGAEPVFIRIDAESLYSFARYPDQFPPAV